jgi:hypothetical protein
MVYELEARRDRQYLEKLLITGQTAQLREEMNFGLPDMPSPGIGLELLRDPLRRRGLVRAARELVEEKYTWGGRLQLLEQLLLGGAAHPAASAAPQPRKGVQS